MFVSIGEYEVITNKQPDLKWKGWFHFSVDTLKPIIEQCSRLLAEQKSKDTIYDTVIFHVCELCLQMNDAITIAKYQWYQHLAKDLHNMWLSPWEAWNKIKNIAASDNSHHHKPTIMSIVSQTVNLLQTKLKICKYFIPI